MEVIHKLDNGQWAMANGFSTSNGYLTGTIPNCGGQVSKELRFANLF